MSFLISSSLYLEFIAHSPYSLDIFALISHLASELLDMRVYGSGIAKVIIVPYIVEYLLSLQVHALVRDKILKQLELLEAELNRLAIYRHHMSRQIHLNTSGYKLLI